MSSIVYVVREGTSIRTSRPCLQVVSLLKVAITGRRSEAVVRDYLVHRSVTATTDTNKALRLRGPQDWQLGGSARHTTGVTRPGVENTTSVGKLDSAHTSKRSEKPLGCLTFRDQTVG